MVVAKSNLYVFIVLSIFAILQFFIDNSFENIVSVLICFCFSNISLFYVSKIWKKGFFLSSIPIIGCLIGTQLGPLVFQTLYLTPIVFNLRLTYISFAYTGLFLFSLIIGHYIYINSIFFKSLSSYFNKGNQKLGFNSEISGGFVILFTILGLFSLYYGATNEVNTGDAGGKFLAIFGFFVMLPLAYFVQGIQKNKRSKKWYFITILLYFFLLVVLGLIKNSRGTFANFGLCFLIILFYFIYVKLIVINKKNFFYSIFFIIPLIYLFSFLSKISNLMVLARGDRDDVKGIDFIAQTLSYKDSNLDKSVNYIPNSYGYNEYYLSNDFLGRLTTIKYSDNIFYYSNLIEGNFLKINEFLFDKTIAILPQPIINLFFNDFNKDDYIYSYGDWIHNISEGASLGGFKLGSLVGSGINLFGFSFFFVTILVAPLINSFIDSFDKKYINRSDSRNLYIGTVSTLILYTLFLIPNSDSLMVLIGFFTRGILQILILYLVAIFTYKLFLKILRKD